MPRTFGKYRSRKKKAASDKPVAGGGLHENVMGAVSGAVSAVKKVKTADVVSVVKKKKVSIQKAIFANDNPPRVKKKQKPSQKSESYQTGGGIQTGGAFSWRLHVPKMDKRLLANTVAAMDDHQLKGLKHGARYITGEAQNTILHHSHRGSQHKKHFQQIARTGRRELAKELRRGDSDLHQAVHEAMHSAKLGGGFDFDHAIHIAKHMVDPVEQVEEAKDQYDQIDFNDTSAKGVVRNAGHAYSGNFHVGSGYLKAASLVAPEAAGLLLPASEGMDLIGQGFSGGVKLL